MACFSGPEIVNSNLQLLFDKSNINSYSGSGTAWKDIVRNTSYSDTLNTGCGSETWMGSASSGITISAVINKIGTVVGYAEHPVNKWINTTDASFVLYHFGTTSGATDLFKWYGNRGGTWGSISDGFTGVNGSKYAITLQYNDTTGGQLWVNGSKIGGRFGAGTRADTATSMVIYGPVGSSYSSVETCYAWNRELTDNEIKQNFEALRGRYNI